MPAALAVVAALAGPSPNAAQTVSAGLVTGWGAPNSDRSTGVELAVESGRMPFRAILVVERGSRDGFGAPCEPAIVQFCENEPLEHSTTMITLGVGWSFAIAGEARWRAGVGPELFLTRLAGTTRGAASGRDLSTRTIVQGAGATVDLTWSPAAASAWSVRLRTSLRGRLSLLSVRCDDCYDPFEESFVTRELSVAAGYRFDD